MMISAIVATRDRALLLDRTVQALCGQEPPGCPYEILVVDNGSVDETPEIIASAARNAPVPIVYVSELKPGKSNALNAAITHARGDVLVFTDDDVMPSPGWLAALVRALNETGADYATGRILPLWEAPAPRWFSPALGGALSIADGGTRRLMLSTGRNEDVMPLGGNLALRRYVIQRIGGWNPGLGSLKGTLRTGEDHEFALRMAAAGFIGVYEPDAVVRHRVPLERLRLAYLQRWAYGNGKVEAFLEEAYPSTPHYLLKVPRYLWRKLLGDLLRSARALVTFDVRGIAAGWVRLAGFAGYLWGRWKRHPVPAAIPAQSTPVSGNGHS